MTETKVSFYINAVDKASDVVKTVGKNVDAFWKKVEKSWKDISKWAEDNRKSFENMRNYGAIAFAGLVAAQWKFLADAVELGESVNAVEVVFGEAAWKIKEFGETAATTAGLAEADFYQMATLTGALLKDTWISFEELGDKTNTLTQRAADMASVFNTSVPDAMNAINAALRGETEAIRRYAGDVTDASLETYRLAEWMTTAVADMSEHEKRLLRYDVIMKQTAVTAGDFANTSDSLANQQRIFQAEMKNLSTTLWAVYIPLVQSLLEKVRPVIAAISEWITTHPELAKNILLAATAVAWIVTVIGILGLALPAIITWFTALGVVIAALMSPIVLIVAWLALLTYRVVTHWEEIKKAVDDAAKRVAEKLLLLLETFVWFHAEAIRIITVWVIAAVAQFVEWVTLVRNSIVQFGDNLVTWLKTAAQNWLQKIIDFKNNVRDAFVALAQGALAWGKNLMDMFIDGIKAKIDHLRDIVSGIASDIGDFLWFSSPTKKGAGSNAHKWMPNLVNMMAKGLHDGISKVWNSASLLWAAVYSGVSGVPVSLPTFWQGWMQSVGSEVSAVSAGWSVARGWSAGWLSIVISGNQFYWTNEDMVDQIGDAIMQRVKTHMEFPSF